MDLIFSQSQYAQFLYQIRGRNGQHKEERPVKSEETFERDLILSALHRDWGWDVPACDIDFLEYDHWNPVALVEYKKRNDWQTSPVNMNANLTALSRLGSMAKIPVYCAFYSPDHLMFRVEPVNGFARHRVIRLDQL